MPDDNGNNIAPGHNAWDAFIAFMATVKDILNDWRVMVTLLIVLLLLVGKVAAPEVGAMVESWIRAWRGQP